MKEKLQELLYPRGILPHYKGYQYFIYAIELASEHPEKLTNITKEIYQPIAKRFHTNVANVKKCISTIRNVFMRNGGADLLIEMGGGSYLKTQNPYPKDMIALFATYIQKQKNISSDI